MLLARPVCLSLALSLSPPCECLRSEAAAPDIPPGLLSFNYTSVINVLLTLLSGAQAALGLENNSSGGGSWPASGWSAEAIRVSGFLSLPIGSFAHLRPNGAESRKTNKQWRGLRWCHH